MCARACLSFSILDQSCLALRSKGESAKALIAGAEAVFTEKPPHYPRMGEIYSSGRDGNTKRKAAETHTGDCSHCPRKNTRGAAPDRIAAEEATGDLPLPKGKRHGGRQPPLLKRTGKEHTGRRKTQKGRRSKAAPRRAHTGELPLPNGKG